MVPIQHPLFVCAAILVALAVDRLWGEPPARFHPVVWMGWALAWTGARIAPRAGEDRAEERRDTRAFVLGVLAWGVMIAIIFIAFFALESGLAALWPEVPALVAGPLVVVLTGLLLKPLLSWRLLADEVLAVDAALAQSLTAGRERLSWLVSRDTANLTEVQVRESAIETLAENLNDSIIAPLFWFALLGLPGAAAYRFANTADAMWGYRGVRDVNGVPRDWTWAGKWAARADDVLSWLPARITAVLIGVAKRGMAWRALQREATKTPSPNSGWPMAAMALQLDVALSKPQVYALNPTGRAAAGSDIGAAVQLARRVVRVVVGAALVLMTVVLLALGLIFAAFHGQPH